MPRSLSASDCALIVVGILAVLAITILLAFLAYAPGTTVKSYEITDGNVGVFTIGETKTSLLSRLPNEAYSPQPKPSACPANWIEVKNMSVVQQQCLMGTDQWEIGSGIRESCPEKADFFATLFFIDNKVVKVGIRCTRPV